MIYFNNAATSFPKPKEVIDKVNFLFQNPFTDTGRSIYSEIGLIESCRENIASFFGINNRNRLIFTSGATESLNMVIRGLDYSKKRKVLTTCIEHNSVIRPLKHLEKEGLIEIIFVKCNKNGEINKNEIFQNFEKNDIYYIVINHCSNVTGAVTDIAEICKVAKEKNILSIIDCSQSAGVIEIDANKIDADALAFAGHKNLFGFPGIGLLYLSERINIKPLKTGGTGIKSDNLYQPEEFPIYLEAGTKNLFGIVSLNEGINYIKKVGMKQIRCKKRELTEYLYNRLLEIKKTIIYSNLDNCEGVISFNLFDYTPDDIGKILESSYGIITRTGLHCAPLIHSELGSDKIGGTVRVSFSHYNTFQEIDVLINCLKQL